MQQINEEVIPLIGVISEFKALVGTYYNTNQPYLLHEIKLSDRTVTAFDTYVILELSNNITG